ncbi:MAG: tetratricopeptide repeat protein [Prevotellaceae bacterium]|jgi:TolA-binding protein|nr:tetratricopeptide repeat protein [Prevotellaceae bacterium]
MKLKLLKSVLLVFASVAVCFSAKAQSAYNKAIDLYNKGVYVEAQQLFLQERSSTPATDQTKLSNIDYYNAMCALKLKQSNAEITAQAFINKYLDSKLRNDLVFWLGIYFYDVKNSYRDAANCFQQVKRSELSPGEQGEYDFKYGQTHLKAGNTGEALQYFANAKNNIHTRFASQAEYYYAHTLYEQKKYAAALESFLNLKNDSDYENIVSYYILQIYFYQKEYDKVIAEGTGFYEKAAKQRQGEVARVIAESYLNKNDYAKAREYFDKYENSSSGRGKISAADYYLMAYIDFKQENYDKAAQTLQRIAIKNDTLSQKTLYLLGGIYVNTNKKDKALPMFERAGKMNFDEETTVDAKFNYAKLALEINGDTKPMSDFLKTNKSKANDPQIRNFLMNTYISEKHFDEAIALVENASNPTEQDYANLQKATYYAGLEEFKAKKPKEALNYFDLSLKLSKYDATVASLAKYWKAEVQYSQKDYESAKAGLKNFINTNITKNTAEYKMAHYTLGYCELNDKNINEAVSWFTKYLNLAGTSKNVYTADCYNRIGDCKFKQRDFKKASENYERAYEIKLSNPDYSLYQNALSVGLLNDDAKKRKLLSTIISQYPNSQYAAAAYFESGRMYVQKQDYINAEKDFKTILNKYGKTSYYRQALIELGLININADKNNEALTYYEKLIDEYPNSAEAKTALAGIKDIYINMGKINEFFAYADKKKISVTDNYRDSLSFAAAERQYLMGDCNSSVTALQQYLKDFPNGNSHLLAKYYTGDCYYRNRKYAEAADMLKDLIDIPAVSGLPQNILNRYARSKYLIEDYQPAAQSFERIAAESTNDDDLVEALLFAMRAYYKIKNYEKTVEMATKYHALPKITEDAKTEALTTKAHALKELGKDDESIAVFKILAQNPKTFEGAEATYNVIDYLYQTGKAAEAEKMIFSFNESKTPYAEWLARSFTVLANIYIDKKDYFQAEATINSIIENYKKTDDGVLDEAKETLETLKKLKDKKN